MIGRGIDAVLYYGESDEELKPLENEDMTGKIEIYGNTWNRIKCKEINSGKETDKIECTTIEDTSFRYWDGTGNTKDLENLGIIITEKMLREYCNNWRKMHGLPMRRRVKR